jgi:uncharacterized protein YdaU (DUF1376 family)
MHYYQHHIGDYRKDTSHLTLLEHGIYRQLLDLYYISEKPLDANALRLICARTTDEQAMAMQLLNEFFIKDGDKYFHARCDAEIELYHGKSTKAKASAKVRWNKNKDLQDANALRTDCDGNANHKPLTINHKPLTNIKPKRAEVLENYFEDFWYKYPKKVGKQESIKAWKKAKPDILQVIDALNWQIPSKQWQQEDGKYVPNPATYLNQGRYMDEAPTQEAPF